MNEEETELARVELIIGKILAIGTYSAAIIIIFGLLLSFFLPNQQTIQDKELLSLPVYFNELKSFQAQAYVFSGLFLLILTPVLRVVVSIWSFAKEHDWVYVTITSFVLIILVSSLIYGIIN